MSMEFIRKAYAVPCKRGGQVIYRGRGTEERGTITSAKGAHLMIKRKQAKEVPPDLGAAVPIGAGIATHRQKLYAYTAIRIMGYPLPGLHMRTKPFRPPQRHEIAGLRYYRTASAYNWLGVAMAHPTRAIELLMEQCEPDVLSPMFNIEIDAILRQADEYARSREVLDREVLREMLMHLIVKAAGG